MLHDEPRVVRQGFLWKAGRRLGSLTQKRRHFALVRGYGLAVVIYRKEASDITTSEELKKEMKRRKRIDLLDGADVEPWDPRPGFLLSTKRRGYHLDAHDLQTRNAWVADLLSTMAAGMSQSTSIHKTLTKKYEPRAFLWSKPASDWRSQPPPSGDE